MIAPGSYEVEAVDSSGADKCDHLESVNRVARQWEISRSHQ